MTRFWFITALWVYSPIYFPWQIKEGKERTGSGRQFLSFEWLTTDGAPARAHMTT